MSISDAMDRRRFLISGGAIAAGIAISGPRVLAATNGRLCEVLFAMREYYEALKAGKKPKINDYLSTFYQAVPGCGKKTISEAIAEYISSDELRVVYQEPYIDDEKFPSLVIFEAESSQPIHLSNVNGESDYTYWNIGKVLLPNYYHWLHKWDISDSFAMPDGYYISTSGVNNAAQDFLRQFEYAKQHGVPDSEKIRELVERPCMTEAYQEIRRALIFSAYQRWANDDRDSVFRRMVKDYAEHLHIHESTHVQQFRHNCRYTDEDIEKQAKYSSIKYCQNHVAALAHIFNCLNEISRPHQLSGLSMIIDLQEEVAHENNTGASPEETLPEILKFNNDNIILPISNCYDGFYRELERTPQENPSINRRYGMIPDSHVYGQKNKQRLVA